jgi:hypothetical protein
MVDLQEEAEARGGKESFIKIVSSSIIQEKKYKISF